MSTVSKHPRMATVAATLLVLLAGFSLVRQITRSPYSESIAAHYDDLSLQALKVTDHLPAGAKVVTLVFDGELKVTSNDKFRRLYSDLEKMGRSVLHEERLVFDEEKGWNRFASGFPYNEYLRVAAEYPDADAILSLCEMPYGSNGRRGGDPSTLPPLLLTRLKNWSNALQDMLDEGRVAAAIVPHEEPSEAADPADGFEARYELLTSPGLSASL